MSVKYEVGQYYEYQNVKAYCFSKNRLILCDGRLVTVKRDKYIPDTISVGCKDKTGYLTTKVASKTIGVHRLVATHFIENPTNLPIVDHINENKEDNCVDNLRWVTVEANTGRTYIRDNRALNEARKLLAQVKAKEKAISLKILENTKLVETIRQSLAEESHVAETFRDEIVERIKRYEDKIDKLLLAGEVAAANQYRRTLPLIERKLTKQEEFIALTGKPIKINGTVFRSIRAASDYIYREQLKTDKTRNQQTIRKELRKIHKGLTTTTLMYGQYRIEVLTPQ